MILSVELPDSVARQMHLDGAQGNRRALERLAVDGYRAGELSRGQVSELLGLEFNETERLLKASKALLPQTMEEFRRSSEALEGLLSR